MASEHPQRHLWPALQRRFADQNKPSIAPDRLLRALCVQPLDGQEESAAWTLGFKEVGATMRTASLARDFQAIAAMVDADTPCYLVVYVGDANGGGSNASRWALFSYVPSSCTSFEARKMADNRAGLKAGLGEENFADGGLWCVHTNQISLSNYMRSADGGSGAAAPELDAPPPPPPPSTGGFMRSPKQGQTQQQELAASKIQGAMRRQSTRRSHGGGAEGEEMSDATEAIWEERIKGVRHAYKDSCSRLVGALEELELTLCNLTGDQYRPDEPLLRARVHMKKNLELIS
jgi:hypothetical protein